MKFAVKIPATSANLGPGFDSLGLALNLWNRFELEPNVGNQPITIETSGEGTTALPQDRTHLVAQIFFEEIERLMVVKAKTVDLPPLRLVCHNEVPAGSGLGSSSTAVLGGLILANAYAQWVTGEIVTLNQNEILQQAVAHEGHGDNVVPAMLGGLVIVATDGEGLMARKVPLPAIRTVVCVPEFHFLTSQARSVLPQTISRADAIANIGRAALVVEALRTGDFELLGRAMRDALHEPYRLPLIPGATAAKQAAHSVGASAVGLSGAGPGMIAFAPKNHEEIGNAMVEAYGNAGLKARYWVLDAIDDGATLFADPKNEGLYTSGCH